VTVSLKGKKEKDGGKRLKQNPPNIVTEFNGEGNIFSE